MQERVWAWVLRVTPYAQVYPDGHSNWSQKPVLSWPVCEWSHGSGLASAGEEFFAPAADPRDPGVKGVRGACLGKGQEYLRSQFWS